MELNIFTNVLDILIVQKQNEHTQPVSHAHIAELTPKYEAKTLNVFNQHTDPTA